MHALTFVYIADASLAAVDISWVWTAFWTVMVILVAFVALGYRAGWFLPKYRMAAIDPTHDLLLRKIFGPPEIAARSRRQAQVVPRYQLRSYRSDGFKVVRVAFGGEFLIGSQCVYTAPRDDGTLEDQLLVARNNGKSLPMSFPEQLNEFGRILAELDRTFHRNAREVQASRGNYRERLRMLKERYEVLYEEYRQRKAAGKAFQPLITQLTDYEVKIKDLNKRLDEMR